MTDEHNGESGGRARVAGTLVVAILAVVIIVAAAAALFIALAGVLQSDWVQAALFTAALVVLLWLLGRVIRVAANQNKDPLG